MTLIMTIVSKQFSSSAVQHVSCIWVAPPDALGLEGDRVDIWKVHLSQPEAELSAFEKILASDERARAESFRFELDRRRFIAAHGQLRIILGRYARVDPSRIKFARGLNGKPFVIQPSVGMLKFNLSHSGDLSLVAITREKEVGVDIEEIVARRATKSAAEKLFSARENAALDALPEAERLKAFFGCWTLKEAYLKAVGSGLALDTDSVEVIFAQLNQCIIAITTPETGRTPEWSFVSLIPDGTYTGALAVKGCNVTMSFWDLCLDNSLNHLRGSKESR